MKSRIGRAAGMIAAGIVALLGWATDAQARSEIQFWHGLGGQAGVALNELVGRFNQSQAEFEVKAVYKGTYAETLNAAMTAYRTNNNPPHIVQVSEVGTQSMILSDAIIPVYRLMQQQQIAMDWDGFIDTIIGYYSKDGKLYSMPFNASTPILYYNKDIFRKAGLADKPPATWKDVEAASRQILATGAAKCGFTTPSTSWTMLENTFAWHNQPFASDQNGYGGLDSKLLVNSDFGVMHVEALVRWNKEKIFLYEGPETNGQAVPFENGDCAMDIELSGSIGRFKASLRFGWGTGQLPHWGAPYAKQNTILGGATLWVLKGRPRADDRGVALFLKFVAESRQQEWWATTTGYVPITKEAAKHLEDASFYRKNPAQWTGVSQLLNAKPTPNSVGLRLGNYPEIRRNIELELANIFAGTKTVKEGLDALVSRGNALLRQFAIAHKPWPGEI